jgi:hypothetical protein
MAVVSAGSLAVGDADLPMGERRQFNIVVVDPEAETVSVHVRGMSKEGVFSGTHRDDFGGKTYIDLPLRQSPARPQRPSMTQRLDHLSLSSISRVSVRGVKPKPRPWPALDGLTNSSIYSLRLKLKTKQFASSRY